MTDTKETEPADAAPREGERIAKRLARAGLCSRRDAERWIAEGRVTVDGHRLSSPAVNVTDRSRILVDGKPIPEKTPTRLWRYRKPRGLITTNRDPEGRRTIFDELPEELPRVITIGRLDYNSEGLLLLTNDGELARKLELPSTGWARRYRVRVNGDVDPAALTALAKGITIEGVRYGAIGAQLDRQQGDNAWITMSLTEGKNREVRRICEHMGWQVSRLIRIAYGPFQLGLLEPGGVEEVSPRVVKEQMGAETGGAATAAEKRRLREQAHDEKRRQKREETGAPAQKKRRPGKREREAKWAKPGEAAPRRRDEAPPGAKPFAKRGERPLGKPERPFETRDRGQRGELPSPTGAGFEKARRREERSFGKPERPGAKPERPFETRDRAQRGKRGDRRLEKIEESFETREARSFSKRDDRSSPANLPSPARAGYGKAGARHGKAEPGFAKAGRREDSAKGAAGKPDRPFVKREDREARPAPRDHAGPAGKPGHGRKIDRRRKPGGGAKPGPGHAHRRRPS
jgi:23S rRNA pseudouridine2605 synthase